MSSYADLIAKANALMAEAENVRKAELASVISDIKAKMKEFGITAADLDGGAKARVKGGAKSKSTAEPKFKGPNGELWSGGLGRKPEWVRAILSAGGNIEDYRIKA